MLKTTTIQYFSGALLLFLASSCKPVGPEHMVPDSEYAAAFKGGSSAYASRLGKTWWTVFGDSQLNTLMSSLEGKNFDLRAAEARRNQAYASLGIDRSLLAPQVFSESSATRNRATESDRFGGGGPGGGAPPAYFSNYRVSMSLGYEIDLWGRVRRIVEAGRAGAESAEVSVDQVRLSLQAQLVRNYLAMRFLDTEAAVLEQALGTREESLKLAKERFDAGKTGELDVARAESELASTKAQLVGLEAPRASLENAIAVLCGRNAANFSIAPASITRSAPVVSAGSPASLLGRRPDVFVAERSLAASSANIGVAVANFYPKVSLIGSGGLASANSSDFLKWSSSEFSIGPDIQLPLFQGLRRKADLELAKARHEEALANYQQTVLAAFADVESALAARRGALREAAAQQASITATRKAYDLSDVRYKEGVSSYLDVVDSQRELLNAQRLEVQARGRAFAATVQLIQAMGGGFR
ncbi:efflux transporter outer membrane subunit [Akkermansiaceae bacterium]|nr:efflux transporter outer membrane subunit [Akkermansiaceae bacterium]